MLPTVKLVPGERKSLVDCLIELGFVDSKSEGKRAIQAGGVRINGVKITDKSVAVILS